METVLDVYERPYDANNPVVCLDESPKQLISELRTSFKDSSGVVYQDYEYKREGVRDIYMVTEPLSGFREVHIEQNHNRLTYAKIIQHIAQEVYPGANKITIVEDNLSAHKLSALYEILPPLQARAIIERLEIVRTPKHGSWLNIAECELSVLLKFGLKKRTPDEKQLKSDAAAWAKYRNKKQKGVNWQFTSKDARIKLKKLYPSIID
jgi:DDE superfamily endonuclease